MKVSSESLEWHCADCTVIVAQLLLDCSKYLPSTKIQVCQVLVAKIVTIGTMIQKELDLTSEPAKESKSYKLNQEEA